MKISNVIFYVNFIFLPFFDKLFTKNMLKYTKGDGNMDMKGAYEKSLQMIKEKEIKSMEEYLDLISEENLLSIPALEYISGKKFKELTKDE